MFVYPYEKNHDKAKKKITLRKRATTSDKSGRLSSFKSVKLNIEFIFE